MLSIQRINKTYTNGVTALDNLSLDIGPGMFGLLGPNGAGKSSLMRTIATLQLPDSGSIRFGDIDVLKSPQALRRQLGYLPQDFGLYPKVSALELLDHFAVLKGLTRRGERREMVEALLHKVNLWEARKRNLAGFSGGMRQRFGIAQALLGAPKLVIVDEPTAGLDPDERNRFLNLLAGIGEEVVVILSTHIVADVTDLCEQMAMVVRGRVIACGEPSAAIRTLDGKLWRRSIAPAQLDDYRRRLAVLSSRLQSGCLQIHVYAEDAPDEDFVPVDATLEDFYFLKLAGAGADALPGRQEARDVA